MNRKPTKDQALAALATLLDWASHDNARKAALSLHDADGLADTYTKDAETLAGLASMIRNGNIETAKRIARRFDTALRDQVPGNLWENF